MRVDHVKPLRQPEPETDVGLFDTVFDQDAVGMAVRAVDPRDSRWLRVNRRFCSLLGYTREELLQMTAVELSPPDERDLSTEYNEQLLRGVLSSHSREMRYLRKDGTEVWTNTSSSAVLGPDGIPVKIISVIHDITHQKLAEKALIEAQEKLEQIVEERTSELRTAKENAEAAEELLSRVYRSSPALFTVSSPKKGRHFNVNDAWSSITGYSREEALENTVLELNIWAHPEDRVEFVKTIKERGFVRNFETVYRTKSGDEKNMLISGDSIDFRGEECLLVVGQDVTEQKQAQKALKEAHDELEQFAYSISHDLKSPLVTVNSFVGLLGKDLEAGDHDRVAKDMQHIESAVTKMGRSIDDLLELSRVGRAVIKPQKLSLNLLCDEVISILQGPITDSAVEIEIAPEMPPVFADKHQVSEVLQNLLENAIKFCRENDAPRISIDAEIRDNRVQCRISDNGIGIDPKYHDKVFGLFDRLDPSIEGSGVGLSMVRRIIEIHDGKVWIESDGVGQGTQVFFTLPVSYR